jgi:hypothetical protein
VTRLRCALRRYPMATGWTVVWAVAVTASLVYLWGRDLGWW